jgi:glycosyltransferase involved in cell wall biosynthesis
LSIVTPAAGLPFSGYVPPLNRVNGWLAAHEVRSVVAENGWDPPSILVATFPKHLDLLGHFPGCRVLYDVVDDYRHFFNRWQGMTLQKMHTGLLSKADWVTVSSEVLAQRSAQDARAEIRVVGNAIPSGFEQTCAAAEPDAEVSLLPAPRFGYVGTVGRWVDIDLLASLARSHSNGSVVLVGPVERPLQALPDNVHVMGSRRHGELPGILRALDVGLVPFKRGPLTDAVCPVKVYEYLAARLAVLSTPFAGIKAFGEDVVSAAARDWADAATTCLERGPRTPNLPLPTWGNRVNEIWSLVGDG